MCLEGREKSLYLNLKGQLCSCKIEIWRFLFCLFNAEMRKWQIFVEAVKGWPIVSTLGNGISNFEKYAL